MPLLCGGGESNDPSKEIGHHDAHALWDEGENDPDKNEDEEKDELWSCSMVRWYTCVDLAVMF